MRINLLFILPLICSVFISLPVYAGEKEDLAKVAFSSTEKTSAEEQDKDKSANTVSKNPNKGLKVLLGISAGLGVAALGGGVGFWAAANSKNSDFETLDKEVANGTLSPDDSELLSLQDKVNKYDSISLVMFISGGVMIVTSAIITGVLISKKKNLKKQAVIIAPGSMSVRF